MNKPRDSRVLNVQQPPHRCTQPNELVCFHSLRDESEREESEREESEREETERNGKSSLITTNHGCDILTAAHGCRGTNSLQRVSATRGICRSGPDGENQRRTHFATSPPANTWAPPHFRSGGRGSADLVVSSLGTLSSSSTGDCAQEGGGASSASHGGFQAAHRAPRNENGGSNGLGTMPPPRIRLVRQKGNPSSWAADWQFSRKVDGAKLAKGLGSSLLQLVLGTAKPKTSDPRT
jgi:hypothetical protein